MTINIYNFITRHHNIDIKSFVCGFEQMDGRNVQLRRYTNDVLRGGARTKQTARRSRGGGPPIRQLTHKQAFPPQPRLASASTSLAHKNAQSKQVHNYLQKHQQSLFRDDSSDDSSDEGNDVQAQVDKARIDYEIHTSGYNIIKEQYDSVKEELDYWQQQINELEPRLREAITDRDEASKKYTDLLNRL